MRKPCIEDLRDTAALLRVMAERNEENDFCNRVAIWLDSQILGSDRQQARKLGCSVKYLRWMRAEEARLLGDANASYSSVQLAEIKEC